MRKIKKTVESTDKLRARRKLKKTVTSSLNIYLGISWDIMYDGGGRSSSQIHSPWIWDIVDSGLGLSFRPVSLDSLGGRYENPMQESTLSPQSGTMNKVPAKGTDFWIVIIEYFTCLNLARRGDEAYLLPTENSCPRLKEHVIFKTDTCHCSRFSSLWLVSSGPPAS